MGKLKLWLIIMVIDIAIVSLLLWVFNPPPFMIPIMVIFIASVLSVIFEKRLQKFDLSKTE